MKKSYLAVVLLFVFVLAGCSTSDLAGYRAAFEETESIPRGEMSMLVDVDIVFDDSDMSFEERRDLSYFERMDLDIHSKYDESDDGYKVVSEVYSSFGGMGIDTTAYFTDDIAFLKLPIADSYIRMYDAVEPVDNKQGMETAMAMEQFMDAWYKTLQEEDVFSGKMDFIMTDKGQIKTTTYTITINNPQFQILKDTFLDILEDKEVLKTLLSDTNQYNGEDIDLEEVQVKMRTMVEGLTLDSFDGVAYVDFDGRLVKQEIELSLLNEAVEQGEVKSATIYFEIAYDNLGVDPQIEIPNVQEEDLLQFEDIETLQEVFY